MSAPRPWRFYALVLAVLVVGGGLLWIPFAEGDAVSAERAHITETLENETCVKSWTTSAADGAQQDASVTGLAPFGYRITVTVPYSYSWETEAGTIHADGGSEAVYEVTLTSTRRVSGDVISPC